MQDGLCNFTIEKVKVKNLTAKAALTWDILSETMRDESTLTYADNVLNYSLNICLVACKVKNMRRNVFRIIQVVFENH